MITLESLLENLRGEPVMESSKVAETIAQQLGGLGRLKAMIGAKHFAYEGKSLQFKFPNRRGPNYVKITLAPDDTYTMDFGRIVKWDLKNKKTLKGIYFDQMKEVFERETGLRLSL